MKDNDITDRDLRRIFKASMPVAGRDPEFARKVINRLPERRPRVAWIVPAAYILSVVIAVAVTFSFVEDVRFRGGITLGDLLLWGLVAVTAVASAVAAAVRFSGVDT